MTCTLTEVPYIAAAQITRQNLLLNPALGADTGGVPANAAVVSGTGGATSLAVTAADGNNPPPVGVPATRHLTVTQTTTATAGSTTVFLFGQQGQVVAGTQYRASAWIRSNEARQMLVGIEWQNASGVAVGYSSGTPVMLVDGATRWYQLQVVGIAPATATRANLQVATTTSMTAGQRFRFCAPMLSPAALDGTYFEVGQPVPVGSWAAWSGAAHASFSTLTTKAPYLHLARWSEPTLLLDYAAPRESGATEHQVIGRPDPVHALGPLRARRGTLELFYPDHESAVAAQQLHTAPRIMLRDTDFPAADMYYVPRSVGLAPEERTAEQRWKVTVEYTEVYATAGLY